MTEFQSGMLAGASLTLAFAAGAVLLDLYARRRARK